MIKLLPLFAVCFFMGYLTNKTSRYDDGKECYLYRSWFCFLILCVYAIVFAGLRTNYNDTSNYILGYEQVVLPERLFGNISWKIGDYPGFFIVQDIIKSLGFSSQSFILILSAFTIGIQFWFIRKYSNNIGLAVFFFFTMGCFGFSMAAVKQCVSISICLIGIDRLIKRKTVQFILYILLATTFHPFAVIFLVTPLLDFKPWGYKTYILLIVAVVAGFSMQYWLGEIIDFIKLMGIEYDEKLLAGEGVNIFRLAVLWAPVILSLITKPYWDTEKNNQIQNLMINLMMLNAAIMFIALFGNPVYFGRLASYFLIFQVIGTTYLLQYFNKQSRRIVIVVFVVLYSAYAYYGFAINGIKFDDAYKSISFITYLRDIFI